MRSIVKERVELQVRSCLAIRMPEPRSRARGLVVALGSHVCRLGISGTGLPDATIPSIELPLRPPGAVACGLRLAASDYLSLALDDLRKLVLFIVEPSNGFGHAERVSLARGSLKLLKMPQIVFLPSHVAVALACGVDRVPHIIVDIGWKSSRVLIHGNIVSVVNVGLEDVDEHLRQHMPSISNGMDYGNVRARACYFLEHSPTPPETVLVLGDLMDDSGNILVQSRLRHTAPEVLFGDSEGKEG